MLEEQENSKYQDVGSVATEPRPEPVAAQPYDSTLYDLHKRINSGASWFYWIAGLSIINSLVVLFHGSFAFIVGLGVTQIIDAFIAEYGGLAAIIGLPVNLMIAGIYVMFGYFACRRARWAFITGMILYSLDGLIFLAAKDILGVGFHVFALFCIYGGLKADKLAREVEASQASVETAGETVNV